MDLNEAIEAAAVSAERRRQDDPELNSTRIMSILGVVQDFAIGVMSATPAFPDGDYELPPRFESVVNWVSTLMKRKYGPVRIAGGDVLLFESSINRVVDEIREIAYDHPAFLAWNNPSDRRPFIDLDAVFQNVTVAMRERTRVRL